MKRTKFDREDRNEPGPFRTTFNRLGRSMARILHHTAIMVDRMIRRLETPAPRLREGIEPAFAGPSGSPGAPAPALPREGVEATLMAVDGLAVKASATAMQAMVRFDPESADGTERSAMRALAAATARAAEDYAAITAETLGLATPPAAQEPVWASGLASRFSAIIAAAEALLESGEKVAPKARSKNRPGV